ncbi:MAG: TraR/DksA family transcriptional regulator [Gammaproteobacteria bacterium]|nr:TraR/DksA family transcriptional regulator [Gammaproteobacteria bacterium]
MGDDLDQYKCLLNQRMEALDELENELQHTGNTVELDQTCIGRLSRMDAMQAQAMAQAGQQRCLLERQQIQSALQRLAVGDYGYCLICDEAIPSLRLQANPAAPLCIQCASAHE